MPDHYYRPLCQTGSDIRPGAMQLAGGWCRFDQVEVLRRNAPPEIVAVGDVPEPVLALLRAPRPDICALTLTRPRIMGILNVTPDSFSDGGLYAQATRARDHAVDMMRAGADLVDIGGESTRPGAAEIDVDTELQRVLPVVSAVADLGVGPISIDTRKAVVAAAAVQAGAGMINDVSGFEFDPDMARTASACAVPVCLMHARGLPDTMQIDPRYDTVLLDVYDALAEKVQLAEAHGIPKSRILVDPGIGFGKTLAHNLALLRRIGLFHGLGCAILVGASRKRFIGTVGGVEQADARGPGSVAVAMEMVRQGVQMLRVHDVADTRQALSLQLAMIGAEETGR